MVNWRERGFTRLATTLMGILVIALAGGLAFGQNFSAAISGSVRDTTGAVVPGVSVTARGASPHSGWDSNSEISTLQPSIPGLLDVLIGISHSKGAEVW